MGKKQTLTRRDFLNGVAVAAGSACLPPCAMAAPAQPTNQAGASFRLDGQFDGPGNALHALRDGRLNLGAARDTGEEYDLVVVGAGLSGLTAAHLFHQHAGPGHKVLLLEAAADFGGHAKRNEWQLPGGPRVVGYGGSQSLQSPSRFSPLVNQVLQDVGIELKPFERHYDRQWAQKRQLGAGIVFCREAFGRDVVLRKGGPAAQWLAQAPLSESARAGLAAFLDAPADHWPRLSTPEKWDRLASMSYRQFLLEVAGLDDSVLPYFQTMPAGYLGVEIGACSALDACGIGLPGFSAMGLGPYPDARMSPSARLLYTDVDEYIYHFPDGNASVARALLRRLIPAAVSARDMDDLADRAADARQFDRVGQPTRLRLNAPVLRLRHRGTPDEAQWVDLSYRHEGELREVHARQVVLACWHRVIPLITDELNALQVQALQDQQRVPLIYANVLLRQWQPLARSGCASFRLPGHFWPSFEVDFPVSMGRTRFAQRPDQPLVLHFPKVVLGRGDDLTARQQAQAGRWLMTNYRFEELEFHLRDALQRALGAHGFDGDRDIAAITVNRWAHGYSYEYMNRHDDFWPQGEWPIHRARQGWGRVAIANSDSGAYAYAHSAMDQAARAISELLPEAGLPAWAQEPGPGPDVAAPQEAGA